MLVQARYLLFDEGCTRFPNIFNLTWAGVCGMDGFQTGHLLYKMVCFQFFFLKTSSPKWWFTTLLSTPRPKQLQLPIVAYDNLQGKRQTVKDLRGFARTPDFFYFI